MHSSHIIYDMADLRELIVMIIVQAYRDCTLCRCMGFKYSILSIQAMQAKYEGDYAGTLSLGTKALCLNIIGGFVHILFLFAIMFTPILLSFVFNVI